MEKVTSGVPQDSVLGLPLFLLYINDLPNTIDSYTKLFVDNTKIYAKITTHTDTHTLQRDLDKLNVWSLKWKLRFNNSKSKVRHIGKKNIKFQYSMKNRLKNRYLMTVKRRRTLGFIPTPS